MEWLGIKRGDLASDGMKRLFMVFTRALMRFVHIH